MKRTTKHTLGLLTPIIALGLLFAEFTFLLIEMLTGTAPFPHNYYVVIISAWGIFILGWLLFGLPQGLKPSKTIKTNKIIEGLEMIIEINDEQIAKLVKYKRLWRQLKAFLDKKVEWNPIIRTAIMMKMEAMERNKEQKKTEQEIEQNIGAFMEWFGHDYREREIFIAITEQQEKYHQIFPQSDGFGILIQYDEDPSLNMPVAVFGFAEGLRILKNCVFISCLSPKDYEVKMRRILFTEFERITEERKRLEKQIEEQQAAPNITKNSKSALEGL